MAKRAVLLDKTPDDINKELLGVKFIAEYTKYKYVPQLEQYRHALCIEEGSEVIGKLANVFDAYDDLDQHSSIKVTPGGGVELLVCFEQSHPFGIHEWKIHTCQVYKEPRYLLVWVTRLRSVKIKSGEIAPVSYKDIYVAVKEIFKMLLLVFVMLLHSLVQLVWALQHSLSVIMVHTPRIIQSLTPVTLAIINALTKCFGGILVLIASIMNAKRKDVPSTQNSIAYPSKNDKPLMVDFPAKSGVPST